jgi:glutaredoxin
MEDSRTKGVEFMKIPTITAYLKPTCGWSQGIRAVFEKYQLKYEDRDIANNPSNHSEMVAKSGQRYSPCVEIDGRMLPDVSADEVEVYLLTAGVVKKTDAQGEVTSNRGWTDHNKN